MPQDFDFVVVGGGSAGAVIASRLSEDPGCRVALLEAGARPPDAELMPVATATLQKKPQTDWMYTADAGGAGLGLVGGRMPVPRGKMLGGSSGMNYMAYVRGHQGDFDAWAAAGATGWSYADVLPYFRKSEGFVPCGDIDIDPDAHGSGGPLGVGVRQPVLRGSQEFVEAAVAAGMSRGDYNGSGRDEAGGVVSLAQTTTKAGKRSSTYRAFLEGDVERRPNLTIITGAHVTRIVLDGAGDSLRATGVEYRTASGECDVVSASKEVIVSAGSVGSPQLLMLSGIGPKAELEAAGVSCVLDSPHVGKHLKDHLEVGLFFPSSLSGITTTSVAIGMGPDALRAPVGPLPADPADDEHLPAELLALKQEAERQVTEWATTGSGVASSSLYDAVAFFNTGLGDHHTHDAQLAFIPCGYTVDVWNGCVNFDVDAYLGDAATHLGPMATSMIVLANPVQPHSEGEIVLKSADASDHPEIRMNYFGDPHDMQTMIAVLRRALDVAAHWPVAAHIGPWLVPPGLAEKHGHGEGAAPSDALLEDLARHFSATVYHLTSTCRIGDVVDARLHVRGVSNLRVADGSIMPNVVSGNTNAACIMIGEKAAEMIAADHDVRLAEFAGAAKQKELSAV